MEALSAEWAAPQRPLVVAPSALPGLLKRLEVRLSLMERQSGSWSARAVGGKRANRGSRSNSANAARRSCRLTGRRSEE